MRHRRTDGPTDGQTDYRDARKLLKNRGNQCFSTSKNQGRCKKHQGISLEEFPSVSQSISHNCVKFCKDRTNIKSMESQAEHVMNTIMKSFHQLQGCIVDIMGLVFTINSTILIGIYHYQGDQLRLFWWQHKYLQWQKLNTAEGP